MSWVSVPSYLSLPQNVKRGIPYKYIFYFCFEIEKNVAIYNFLFFLRLKIKSCTACTDEVVSLIFEK